jgi:hypothetical protein
MNVLHELGQEFWRVEDLEIALRPACEFGLLRIRQRPVGRTPDASCPLLGNRCGCRRSRAQNRLNDHPAERPAFAGRARERR